MTLMPATAGGFADRPAVIAEGTWDGPEPVGNVTADRCAWRNGGDKGKT